MPLSHYIKAYTCPKQPNHLLLYSTRQASLIRLNKETYRAIENGRLSGSDRALLSRLGMIVPDREAEKRSVRRLLDVVNKKNTFLRLTVVLNMDCNFACPYCYEGDMKGQRYMSDQTAEALINFVKAKFTPDKTSLLIDFYGGEPLLSTKRIQSISETLKSFAESRKASYSFTLVTNGSLFNRPVATELAALGLESVKITLDGPPDLHNRSRPFKSGEGSFDAIIKNIKATCDLVSVGIGGNFQKDNYEKFVILLDHMEAVGLTPDKIAIVKFDPVMQCPDGDLSPPHFRGGCRSINEPWLPKAEALLREEILKRGYNTLKPRPMACMVETKDVYVVNHDGLIYKCPAFIGKKGFEAGDLQTGVTDYAASYKLGIWNNETCAECEYLPICFGGCRYMTYIRTGNIDELDCKKAYLDASLETLIKQDIRFRRKS